MQLNYKAFGEERSHPLIILHGLLGSLDNWQTVAKKLSTQFQVFILDQRNHGKSPHSEEFSYELLSNDLLEFVEQHKISKAHVLGHSMGGKAAMKFALDHPEKVSNLIVVDIAPIAYEDNDNEIFEALLAADVKHAESREAVEKVLRERLGDDMTIIQFLMKGLQRTPSGDGFEWRFNVEALHKNYSEIGVAITSPKPFTGKTLFIKGEKSPYINADSMTAIETLFPNNQLSEIKGAGHWVHADKPNEFIEEVLRFLI
jgi:esterase